MIIEKMPDPFDALVIRDTYSPSEIDEIWKELDFLTRENVLLPPEQTRSAKDENGNLLKNNKSIFLYETYNKPEISPILEYTAKNIFSKDIRDFYESINIHHKSFSRLNRHTVLVSYYENNDFYDYHWDECLYSSVTYLFREPKSFEGGNITFKINDVEYTQKIENNLSIIFPSFYNHRVEKIEMKDQSKPYSGLGRYCIAQFAYHSL